MTSDRMTADYNEATLLSAPEFNNQGILCITSCQGSVREGVRSKNEGDVPKAKFKTTLLCGQAERAGRRCRNKF